MASFSESLQSSTSFSPYVQQIPIDANLKVGLQKQTQYNEGVQRIQNQIDNVAGLDVIRDIDKQYLQSKLDELGNNLKTVAAGDFSNFQLVNSTGGMVNQIAKDPTVLNAVGSTQKFREQQKLMQEAIKAGKSSPNREYDFNRGATEWLTSKELNKPFEATYREHVDVNKKVLDVIQKLHPNASIKDIPYAMDEKGNINYKEIAVALQRIGEKGIDEGQIRTAVNAMLDESDIDELASQGRYSYRGFSTEDLQNEAKKSYALSKENYLSKLDELEKQKLTTTDVDQQLKINQAITYYKSLLGDPKQNITGLLDKNFEKVISSIQANPDQARSLLYQRNWLDGVANGFSYKEVTSEVLSNPMRDDMWKKLNYNLAEVKEQHDEAYRTKQLSLEERKLQLEENKEESVNQPYWKTSGNAATDNLDSLQKWNDYNTSMETENKGILQELANSYSTPNRKVSTDEILQKMEKEGPANEYEKQLFKRFKQNAKALATQQELYNKEEDNAYRELTGGLSGKELLNSQLSGIPALTIENGVTFSPKEVYDFLAKETREMTYTTSASGQPGSIYVTMPGKNLTKKEQLLVDAFSERYAGSPEIKTYKNLDKQGRQYINKFTEIVAANKELTAKVTEKVAEKMAPFTGEFKKEQSSVQFKDNTAKNNFISELSNVADADLKQRTGDINYSPKDVLSILQSKPAEEVDFSVVRQGDKYFVNIIDKTNPKNVREMEVDPAFIANSRHLGQQFLNQSIDFAQLMLTQGGSTNMFKDFEHGWYDDLGNNKNGKKSVTIPIVADLDLKGGLLYPSIKVKLKDGNFIEWKSYEPTNRQKFESEYLPSLSDEKIIQLFKETKNIDITNLIAK